MANLLTHLVLPTLKKQGRPLETLPPAVLASVVDNASSFEAAREMVKFMLDFSELVRSKIECRK